MSSSPISQHHGRWDWLYCLKSSILAIRNSEAIDAFCLCVISPWGDEQSDGELLTLVSPTLLSLPYPPPTSKGRQHVSGRSAPKSPHMIGEVHEKPTVKMQMRERAFPSKSPRHARPWAGGGKCKRKLTGPLFDRKRSLFSENGEGFIKSCWQSTKDAISEILIVSLLECASQDRLLGN